MKFRSALGVAAAAAMAFGSATAADTLGPVSVNGPTFTDVSLGQIVLAGLSDVAGTVSAASSVTFGSFTLTLSPVTITGGTFVAAFTGPSFAVSSLAAGIYDLKVSGSVTGPAILAAEYTVTAVPEPGTYALLAAGLAAVGFVAKRRSISS